MLVTAAMSANAAPGSPTGTKTQDVGAGGNAVAASSAPKGIPLPALSIGDTSGMEGSTLTFTVSLDRPAPAGGVTFHIATAPGSAREGVEYVAKFLANQTIPAGSTSYLFTVDTIDDTVVEPARQFYVDVTGIVGAIGADTQGIGVVQSDDTSGFHITPASGETTEAGGSATFQISLINQPAANVTLPLSSSDTGEGTVSDASLVFTTADWNIPRTVTVTGIDDAVDDGDVAYALVTGTTTSADGNYNGLDPIDPPLVNRDDDSAGVAVDAAAGLATTEAGGTAAFTVVLGSEPVADVTVPVSSSDTGEGTPGVSQLVFTQGNWSTPQQVVVTGVDDSIDDSDVLYHVILGATSSSDPVYAGIDPDDVAIGNIDDDDAGIVVTPSSGLSTSEAGAAASFAVVLASEPLADVNIGVASGDTTEGSVGVASLTFTPANWNQAQTVLVTGVDDAVADGNLPYTVTLAPVTSTDPTYSGMAITGVSLINIDDDAPGITVSPTAGLATSEPGGSATFTVVLASAPTADVTIPLSSSDPGEGTVAPTSLTFTAANWNTAQTVTATGVDDAIEDGDVAWTVVLGAAGSADPGYAGIDPPDVAVTNADDDATGIVMTPVTGLETTEAGGGASFTVVLGSEPTADVTLPFGSSDDGEGTVAPTSLVFTPANWQTPQTVTVTGVDDVSLDGDVAYTVERGVAISADPAYAGTAGAGVGVVNRDDEVDRFDGNTATGTGAASIAIDGGSCSLDLAQTAFGGTAGLQVPNDVRLPHGALRFRAQGCMPGTALSVEVTWPSADADATLWKLDASAAPLALAATRLSPTTYRYIVVDGGALDADGVVNGVIVDPVALGIADGTVPPAGEARVIPVASPAGRALLILLLAGLGLLALRRRG